MYEVGDLSSHHFQLSIDHRYFAVRSASNTIGLYDLQTGSGLDKEDGRDSDRPPPVSAKTE